MTRALPALLLLAAACGSSRSSAPAAPPPEPPEPSAVLAARLLQHEAPRSTGMMQTYAVPVDEAVLADATRQFDALIPALLEASDVEVARARGSLVYDGYASEDGELVRLAREHGSHRVEVLFRSTPAAVPLLALVLDTFQTLSSEVIYSDEQACIRYLPQQEADPAEEARLAALSPDELTDEIFARAGSGTWQDPSRTACAPLP